METLGTRQARRLALARAGLLAPAVTGMPSRAAGAGRRARAAAHAVIGRFGYLQLDTVSIAGARSHVLVLLSRLAGFEVSLGEALLVPGAPVFEYWGHEASWLPMELYPAMAFRRRAFRRHPWWGDLVGRHPQVARDLLARIRDEGPLRSADMEGRGGRGWWELKLAKKVATALWSSGELAIRERRQFQRSYDLAERVIPEEVRRRPLRRRDGLAVLLLAALDGHGWATTGTLVATWRLRRMRDEVEVVLGRLRDEGVVVPCTLVDDGDDHGRGEHVPRGPRRVAGWIRPEHLEEAAALDRRRPRGDRGVLLSPFDPVLWDRGRVRRLFGFDQVLEVFKPRERRLYGYYCLPVLAGERLLARVDLEADRAAGRLTVVSRRFEGTGTGQPPTARDGAATGAALARHARSVGLAVV